MAKHNRAEVEVEEVVVPAEVVEVEEVSEPTVANKSHSSASVYTDKGNFIRTYSLAEHGKGYIKLAEMYAGKIHGEVRVK